jgi:hypothetical protein
MGWWAWRGGWAAVLGALLATEIVITLADFVVEDRTRRVAAGERVLHATMAIVYGAMVCRLLPILAAGAPAGPPVPTPLAVLATLFGLGIAASGLRDATAAAVPQRPDRGPRGQGGGGGGGVRGGGDRGLTPVSS